MKNAKKQKVWGRSKTFNYHHLRPRSKGGEAVGSNLIRMDVDRHNAWHYLFQNLTLTEIIEVLTRLESIKGQQALKMRI